MSDIPVERTFAFAALVQAAQLVDDIAFGRAVRTEHLAPLLRSVFATNPEAFSDVYGGYTGLGLGVKRAQAVLGRATPELLPVTRYALAAIDLAEKLRHESAITTQLTRELDQLQAERTIVLDEPPYLEISRIYQHTLSTLQRRIQVKGVPDLLAQEAVAAQVRTMLLAAVRAAWLWRQLGGRRWHLVFLRTNMRAALAAVEAQLIRH